MNYKKIRWGVLSTAKIAREMVIPALQRAENAEVVAIASSSGKAQEVAAALQIPKCYQSYEECLKDPEIDAVYIPLPNSLHKEWTIKAADAKKHVLVEKPAALNAAEVEAMIAASKDNQVYLMEAFMYRFHPQHAKVKELLEEGTIGDVKLVRSSFSFYMEPNTDNIRLRPELGGGSVYDVGCYCINVIRYLLGEPESVYAHSVHDKNGVEITTNAILNYPNNVRAVFDSSFDMTMRQEYEVIGTKGMIRVPYAFRPDKNDHHGLIEIIVGNQKKEITVQDDQYLRMVEHFSECILHGKEVNYPMLNTLQNMKVIDAVYESIQKGESIKVPVTTR